MHRINLVDPLNVKFDSSKINIWNFTFLENPELIQSMSANNEHSSIKIPARKCNVRILDKETAIDFLKRNHIKGSYGHQHGFGLYFENELVSVMTFSRSRYNKNYKWEIIRFASKINHSVVGGASKLLKFAKLQLNSDSFFSYSENMIGVGNLYKQIGFEFLGETGPGFFWYRDGEILHRMMATKKLLVQKYPDEETLIKETSISKFLKSKGYVQVNDMGNKRWGMNPIEPNKNLVEKIDLFFMEVDGEIIQVSEDESTNFKPVNLRKIECREMVHNNIVKLIPLNLVSDFQEKGWNFNTKKPGNSGMIKIKKGDDTKFIKIEDWEFFKQNGWKKTNRNKTDKKYARAPATSGKVGVKKDGVKKMVLPDEALSMVKYQGWELCAASCWRLASDEVKKLGRELGYDV